MAAALAHELNQPLTAAASAISAARRLTTTDESNGATVRDVMDEAAEQVLCAGQVIRRLRGFVTPVATEKRVDSPGPWCPDDRLDDERMPFPAPR